MQSSPHAPSRDRQNLLTHRVRYNPHLHTTAAFAMLVHALDQPPGAFPRFDLRLGTPDHALPAFQPDAAEHGGVRSLTRSAPGARA